MLWFFYSLPADLSPLLSLISVYFIGVDLAYKKIVIKYDCIHSKVAFRIVKRFFSPAASSSTKKKSLKKAIVVVEQRIMYFDRRRRIIGAFPGEFPRQSTVL